jgi:mannose-1-phosphate guanylyltransferase
MKAEGRKRNIRSSLLPAASSQISDSESPFSSSAFILHPSSFLVKKAFVLAAGQGTRLRPLTDQRPKPLIPVGHKPLITFAFDHLIAEAGVEEFIVNTHHLAPAYAEFFPDNRYRSRPIHFRHEPVLLETGGGLKNIADLVGDETFLVYNGDVLTDLPLAPAIAQHRAAGNLVTLVLRSSDGPRHIAWDASTGRITDIRNRLGTGHPTDYAFSCVYLVEPEFLQRIPAGEIVSVIPIFLEMIRRGEPFGGIVIDSGEWRDLGSRGEYLRVHRDLLSETPPVFPRYGAPDPGWRDWIHPTASIAPDARVLGASVVGAGTRIGAGATVENSILWPDAEIASQSDLKDCIVRASQSVSGQFADRDF